MIYSRKFSLFVGLHQPSDCVHFERSFVSINRIKNRRSNFPAKEWILDSGAFTEVSTHGRYRTTPEEYAAQIERWKTCGRMLAAVSQDWMCEPFIIQKTGLTVLDHQRMTVERYEQISALTDAYVMPVIQGFTIQDYLNHLDMYGARLKFGSWSGVGSICKRNSDAAQIEDILLAIREKRPDLLLHGFGLKLTALASATVRSCLHTADSMAWSFSARKQGRNANDWREAKAFEEKIENQKLHQKPPKQEEFLWN